MGGHYGTIHVRADDRDAVRSAVERLGCDNTRRFLIAPAIGGWVTVFPENNGQDERVSEALAAKLPDKTLIHCLVHDDDVFAYWLFEGGRVVDAYNSCPDYFGDPNPPPRGGNARALAHLLRDPAKVNELQTLLDADRFDFELERQDQFAALLGLPNTAYAYEYLQGGETDGVRQWKKFIHVPDLAPEKAARRAAAAKDRAELKQMQRDGILLVEERAKKSSNKHFFQNPVWALDSTSSAVVLSWQDEGARTTGWRRFSPPDWRGEPWVRPGIEHAQSFWFSPSGSLLAVCPGNYAQIDIWDARANRLMAQKPFTGSVATLAFSSDENWLFVSVHNSPPPTQLHRVALRPGLQDAVLANELLHFQAIIPHPEGRLLAVLDNFGLLLVVEVETFQIIHEAWIKEANSPLPEGVAEAIVNDAAEKMLDLLKAHMSAAELKRYRLQSARHFLPKEAIRLGLFSPDGHWLFCGTNVGLRALDWSDVLRSQTENPVPVRFSADAEPAQFLDRGHNAIQHRLVYGVVYDALRRRVLYSGLEGKICFLNLDDGHSGTLLMVPARMPLIQLALTHDRSALVATAHPLDFESRRSTPSHFQIWSYPALCRTAGLEY